MNITGKTILITGANRGIGRALLDEALRRGAQRVYAGTRVPFSAPDERVTPLALDVTNGSQIQQASAAIESLDVLINNAGVAIYDDLSQIDVVERHLAVNLLGPLKMTNAFLPALESSRGAIVNILSLAAIAALPPVPGYSISKAAASNLTQSFRAFLAKKSVSVHGVYLGPVDTDMNRGFEIPKADPKVVAQAIFAAMERNEEDIFPDPVSQPLADGWRNGVVKGLEREFAAFAA